MDKSTTEKDEKIRNDTATAITSEDFSINQGGG
jgi:hypothetical protein